MRNVYQHALVAIDLSDAAAIVLAGARALLAPRGRLQVLHVEDSRLTGGFGVATGLGQRVADIRARQEVFARLKPRLRESGVDPSHLEIRFGRPADEIVEDADHRGCDLIVIGSHGVGGVRALLGSTANSVVRQAHCDVCTVRIPA